MQKPDPLIRTKLRLPFIRPGLVSRPRLQEQIAQGLCTALTLITAPAGFGKTTLVATCVAGCGMPVAWLSLDKDDNQVARFLTYLVAALQEADPTIGNETAQLLALSQQASTEAILTSLINDLDASGRELALVLDDYQFLKSQAVHASVTFLLDHCPKSFHLVIATRSDPPLPLARLRARGLTVELRAADLRFTEAEAAQFLNDMMGLRLDAMSVAVLEERTEGWIAGLQMAALSMRDREDVPGFIEGFSGTNRHILDFLLEEVLAREPEEVQAFLLQTAILTRLTGPLCDEVTGGSGGQEMLERLERGNLFVIPLDDDRRWYRYHHLFADLLQARLHQSGPDSAARLFSRASEWCEREGQVADAISYALNGRDYGRAAGLISRYWQPVSSGGEIETVWSWLNALPEDVVRTSASLSIAYCWVLWLRAQIDLLEEHLVDAEHAVSDLVLPEKSSPEYWTYAVLVIQLSVLRSIIARRHDEFEAASSVAERALNLLPENLPPQANAQLHLLIFLALASAYDGAGDLEKAVGAYAESIRWSRLATSATGLGITFRLIGALRLLGRLRSAEAACQDALRYVQSQGMARLPAAGILHIAMSEVLVERNDLAGAQAHLAQGIELGKWSGRLDAEKNAAYSLSRLRQARQDMSGALAAVQEAESALDEPNPPLAKAELFALKSSLLVRQGRLTEAAKCAEEAVQLAGRDRGQTGQLAALATCRVLLAQSEPGEAVVQLAQSLTTAEESGRLGVAIELHILRSLALLRRGDAREAQADLEQALALAEPEGYARIFLDEGQPLQQLLAQWISHADPNPLRDYAIGLLSQFDTGPNVVKTMQGNVSPAGDLIEPLTPRELEVLQLICLGDSNQAIANKLFITVKTVKKHTGNIFGKLGVTSRAQAMVKARQIGLLPKDN